MNMPATPKPARKIKRSFSISAESDAFIRKARKERRSPSESETLDALLSELISVRQQHLLDSAWKEYYDSLTSDDIDEQLAWGTFAESQLSEGVRRR
jgi:hypothetical protein